MKNIFASLFLLLLATSVFAQGETTGKKTIYEFLQITTIESVVPGGLGRSRLLVADDKGQLEEIKLENFFSMVGINFGNIRANDQTIAAKINQLSSQGWELTSVVTGSYSADKSTGIFLTRYLLKREKN
jgi:hypothetical protein